MACKTLVFSLLFLMICAFTGNPARLHAATQYSGGQQTQDISFLWNTQQRPDVIIIKGVATNNFHSKIYQLQLFAVLLDANGKPQGKESIFLGPVRTDLDQSVPFTLNIPVGPSSATPKNIRLEYRYHVPSHAEAYWSWTYGRFNIS